MRMRLWLACLLLLLLLAWSPSASADILTGLVAHWKLDESPASNGTTIVDSAGLNTGTLNTDNGTTDKATTGRIGGAITFDATSDYITVPDAVGLRASSAFTYAFWVKQTALNGGNQRVIHKYDDADNGYYYILDANGSTSCVLVKLAGTSYSKGASVRPALNVWAHVAVTFSSGTVIVYVNGVAAEDGACGLGLTADTHFTIGATPIGTSGLVGSMDDVRMYTRALSAGDVGELFALKASAWWFLFRRGR